jgi:hypothetical protein
LISVRSFHELVGQIGLRLHYIVCILKKLPTIATSHTLLVSNFTSAYSGACFQNHRQWFRVSTGLLIIHNLHIHHNVFSLLKKAIDFFNLKNFITNNKRYVTSKKRYKFRKLRIFTFCLLYIRCRQI